MQKDQFNQQVNNVGIGDKDSDKENLWADGLENGDVRWTMDHLEMKGIIFLTEAHKWTETKWTPNQHLLVMAMNGRTERSIMFP
jgi:hypothetical protein